MPFYHTIQEDTSEGQRTLAKLLELKAALSDIPAKTVDETLLLATWNIRDFDKPAYLPTDRGWVYLSVVMDLFGRKVVGWSIGDSLATDLVSDALRRAIESRRPVPGDDAELLHHSDRGCQYTSDAYQRTLATLGITCSMSRTGCCYDNAVMERFFWSLKHEWANHQRYADLDDARLSVFKYIDLFYNPKRIHQALGYLSPEKYEAEHAPATKAA